MKKYKMQIILIIGLLFAIFSFSSAKAFTHPGLLNNQAELDLMKEKVIAGEQPWLAGYQELDDWFQDLTNRGYPITPGATILDKYKNYKPLVLGYTFRKSDGTTEIRPPVTTFCVGKTPGTGQELMWDSRAAYASALHWIATSNSVYADKAVEIINAWSSTLQTVSTSCPEGVQTLLTIAGSQPQMIFAAEIMRATYSNGWSLTQQNNFKNMLINLMLPNMLYPNRNTADCPAIYNASAGTNNWGVMASETRMAIGIFADRQDLFDKAVLDYKFFIDRTYRPNGKNIETCRGDGWGGDWQNTIGCDKTNGGDLAHTQMTLQAMTAMAEMAKKQGVDLYAYTDPIDGNSLLTTLLYHAPFMGYGTPPRIGFSSVNWPCDKPLSDPITDTNQHVAFWEMAYNHYRDQDSEQKLQLLVENWARPEGNMGWSDVGWGTLTHAYAGQMFLTEDVNSDGQVNIKDIQEVIRCILNPACGNPHSDVNGDGSVNIRDVQLIIRKIINPN